MPKKISTFIFAFLSTVTFCFSQYNGDRGYPSVSSKKPVTEYFDSVDDKSYYQSQRIHGMKQEINRYSERLHGLQKRFDEIFYGLSRGGSFQKPFDTNNMPRRVERIDLFEPEIEKKPFPEGISSTNQPPADLFDPNESNSLNQLAFQVEAPGTYTEDGKRKALFDPKSHTSGALGKYFILTPGYAIPHKIHKPSHPIFNSQKYKRYDPGVSVVAAGGFERNNFRFGLGGMYKRLQHHETSYEFHTSLYPTYPHKGQINRSSETFAGFLDLGYEANLFANFDGFIGLGLGYYLSVIKDPRRNLDHGFFATGNIGVAYNFNQMAALRFGYRYLHEEEAPAHVAELGLDLEF